MVGKIKSLQQSMHAAQDLCRDYDIPTGSYEAFTDPEAAKDYIRSRGAPIVVKADGLAAGKGVVVAHSVEEALAAVDDMLINRVFGEAGTLQGFRYAAHARGLLMDVRKGGCL